MLVTYHYFLLIKNLTTCINHFFLKKYKFLLIQFKGEHLSWKKITYLKEFPPN